tara:strand:+ start:163 stop:972 length:810 start_codon:yes stop_codon:yes gene_type:complete
MSIDFPSAEECNTYGYSFGFYCPEEGVTHTINQNWRVMESPDGTTFYAPVTSSLTVDSSVGPVGASGQTGMTGATGATGMSGPQGPAGITVESASSIGQFVSVTGPFGTEDLTYLKAMSTDAIKFELANNLDIVKVKSIRENVPGPQMISQSTTDYGIDHTASGNNIRLNITDATAKIIGIKLLRMSAGDYVNIIIQGTAPSPASDGFNSEFTATDAGNTSRTTTVDYAGGIKYNMGTTTNDIDVFYVFCLSSTSLGIHLLVNHQRYHQ